jgi:hypothetical protein
VARYGQAFKDKRRWRGCCRRRARRPQGPLSATATGWFQEPNDGTRRSSTLVDGKAQLRLGGDVTVAPVFEYNAINGGPSSLLYGAALSFNADDVNVELKYLQGQEGAVGGKVNVI